MKEIMDGSGSAGYVLVQDSEKNTTNRNRSLRRLYEIGNAYSGSYSDDFTDIFERDRAYLELELDESENHDRYDMFSFEWMPQNPYGVFLSNNTQRESVVLQSPASIDSVESMIHDNPGMSVISFGVYPNGFCLFSQMSDHVRTHHPEIKIIAGAGGARYQEAANYADYLLLGNQLASMQQILGEPIIVPKKVSVISSFVSSKLYGVEKSSAYPILMTSYGCPYGCDFCPSTAEYGNNFSAPHSVDQIVEAINYAHDTVTPGEDRISMSIADPQALGDIPTWKQVFRECRNMGYVVELATTTSSKILQKYTLEELTSGDLCVTCVNIGVESMVAPYYKNKGVDLKAEIRRYQVAGIRIAATFIVGHPWHDHKTLWQDVDRIRDLDPAIFIVSNLLVEPGTPMTNQLIQTNSMFNVPPEFATAFGFQSIRHNQFRPGFIDMLPILQEIEDSLTYNTSLFMKDIEIFLARKNPSIRNLQDMLRNEIYRIDNVEGLTSEKRETMKNAAYYELVYQQPGLFHPYLMWTV